MSEDDINRRNALKKIAGGATATGVLSTMSLNVAAAEAVDGDVVEEDPVEIFEGDQKLSLASDLARTPEFGELLNKAQSEGYYLEWSLDNIYAGQTESGSFRREVASYNLVGSDSDEHAAIHIGRDLNDNSIIFANFDIEHLDRNGIPEETIRFEVVDSSAEAGTEVQAFGGHTADDAEQEIERKVIESDPRAKEQFITELDQQSLSVQGITPAASIPDDFPAELDISTCNGCYYASTLVCRNLCGAGGGFLCGLLGISIVGGFSCVTFVGAVCWVASKAPQCAEPVAATICKGTGLDICGPNEKPGSPLDVDIPQF
ncbi:hypothetical protein HTZ84_19725 [Haloterrigena sp. SYSU A558-1]|uniref:Halocin C8-like N-terminal domain-containing protein n=1 Tax=Haloterrigena gelatinilytica TaxID=2741724 RepID=A0ABX2LI07_9EURY|nr:halocin C8-like domain-containing protein [Haloterrigena gelatinilytica]NUC74498.1 hypothetical protein [Haloterrigena gelatinilytica]